MSEQLSAAGRTLEGRWASSRAWRTRIQYTALRSSAQKTAAGATSEYQTRWPCRPWSPLVLGFKGLMHAAARLHPHDSSPRHSEPRSYSPGEALTWPSMQALSPGTQLFMHPETSSVPCWWSGVLGDSRGYRSTGPRGWQGWTHTGASSNSAWPLYLSDLGAATCIQVAVDNVEAPCCLM